MNSRKISSVRGDSSEKSDHAVFDEDWPSEPPTGVRPSVASVRTPVPPFDLQVFAADSECRIRAAEVERKSTAPPPPHHPSLPTETRGASDAPSEPAMLGCARRAALTHAQLRVGGMSRDEAARVLRAELDQVANAAGDGAARALAKALSGAVAELGGVAEDEISSERSVLVLEDDVDVRDRLTLAIEALGCRVRAVAGSEALTELAAHDTSAVIVGVDAGGISPAWEMLRGLLPLEGVAIVVGAKVAGPGLETLAAAAGADDFVRFDLEVHDMIGALGMIFSALGVR